jgi:hypothetical protein
MLAAILAALSPAGKALMAVLSALWSFLSKPPGIYLLAAILVLLAIWWSGQRGYDRGHAQGKAECEAAHTAAAATEVTRQQKVATIVVQASESRTTKAAAQDRTNGEIVADAKARAESLPLAPPECPAAVPADLADRLRSLR